MIKRLTNNFGWKIISVILAFILWLFVMDYEDPAITKTFRGIEVKKINTESEVFKNKYIEYKEGEKVDIVIKGRRSLIEALAEEDINAFVDLNKTSFTGAIDIQVDILDELEILSKNPTDMMIEYEDIISRQRRVQYIFEGELGENFYAEEPVFSPSYIEITGPESEVNGVSTVLVSVPVEGEEKDITLLAKPKILNQNNEEINSVVTSTEEIEVTVPIKKFKTVPIEYIRTGNIAEGYYLTDISLSENEVVISGRPEIVDVINKLTINNISLNGLSESTVIAVPLKDILPNEVSVYSGSKEIEINVTLEKIIEKTMTINHSDITVKHLSDDLQFSYVNEESIDIVLRGIGKELDKVNMDYLNPYIRLFDLKEGEHDVKLYYTIPYKVTDISEEKAVSIVLEKRDSEEENTETDPEEEITDSNDTPSTDENVNE